MGDRAPGSGVAAWFALRRAQRGGVATLAGSWFDDGRRVPGYVADALDGLTSAGLLALGEADPESCGVRRVTVTDTGSTQYLALCQVHNPTGRAAVSTPHRWALSPRDQRSHLLAERGPDQIGILVAVCGHRIPWSVNTSAQPTERRCPTCEALAAVQLPAPPLRHSPDPGRPPAEHPRPQPDAHRPVIDRRPATKEGPHHRPAADRPSASPEMTPTMPAQPYDPWRDADGAPIPQQCRIEQIAVDRGHGASPSRLHKQGQVLGRGMTRLIVRFDDESQVVRIRPHLVRVVTTPGGC